MAQLVDELPTHVANVLDRQAMADGLLPNGSPAGAVLGQFIPVGELAAEAALARIRSVLPWVA